MYVVVWRSVSKKVRLKHDYYWWLLIKSYDQDASVHERVLPLSCLHVFLQAMEPTKYNQGPVLESHQSAVAGAEESQGQDSHCHVLGCDPVNLDARHMHLL